MCGIAGFIKKKNINTYNADAVVEEMLSRQRHRGPDDQGIESFSFNDNNKTSGHIGFNRLSIRDVSLNGHQPMTACDGKVILAFNGEIYNSDSYLNELKNKGYIFKGHSDTEVLLYLYLEYGIDRTLELISGMFAIVIADARNQKVYIARDRMGEKPMYLYETENELLFASEIKSFYAHPSFEPKLNEAALDEQLIFRYVSGKETLLRNVVSVLPSTYMEYDELGIREKTYYSQKITHNKISYRRACERIASIARDCTERQLISDVPVGVMLSGGVDSSLVTKYVSDAHKDEVQTFSVIFNEKEYTEEAWMDHVIANTKVRANKYIMDSALFFNDIEKCTWHLDMPLAHPNSMGVYQLCEKAKEKVTVLLAGEGADELMCGYSPAYWHALGRVFRRIPLLNRSEKLRKKMLPFSAENFDEDESYILLSAFLTEEDLLSIRPEANVNAALSHRKNIMRSIDGRGAHRYSQYDQQTYLSAILTRTDKMSMAHSMEMRCPYLCHELTDYVRSLPNSFLLKISPWKNKAKYGKRPLKSLAAQYFGTKFTYREKMGWPFPLKAFMTEKNMAEKIAQVYLPRLKERKLFDFEKINHMWSKIDKLENHEIEAFWIVISFEIWAEIYLDNDGMMVA